MALATLLVLAGCSVGATDPISRITPDQHGAGGDAGPTLRTVAEPWRSGLRQLGVAVYWSHSPDDPDSTVRAKAERTMDYIVGLGANSVSISFPYVMADPYASAVGATEHTPPPARLAILLDEAVKRKLRVTIRPLLSEEHLADHDATMWRGSIEPTSRAAWFASYRELLLGYAAVAEASHVDTFVLGAELNSMESSDEGWAKLATAIRAVYHGELGYSANHDRIVGPAPADGLLKSVDAYPSLRLGDGASVAQLVAGWNSWLAGRDTGIDLVLAEVAISARTGAYALPWSPDPDGPIMPEIQQHWFEAACTVLRTNDLAGIYFWMINPDIDPATTPPDSQPMDFVGRPAQQTVAGCFAGGAARVPAGT
jgi:hypothetical protein